MAGLWRNGGRLPGLEHGPARKAVCATGLAQSPRLQLQRQQKDVKSTPPVLILCPPSPSLQSSSLFLLPLPFHQITFHIHLSSLPII
jgi:hypothetical protein